MSGWNLTPAIVAPAAVPAALYAAGRLRLHRRGVGWPVARDAAGAAAVLSVLVAVASPLAAHDEQFPVHVVQHLLLGMVAPLGFALAAPITLLLRASGVRARRRFVAVLHARPIRALSWAPVGLVLSGGSMWALYLSPLYAAAHRHELLHSVLHLHTLVAGSLLAFALVGGDPVPGRGSFRTQVSAMFGALAAHGILAKYLYVHAAAVAAVPGVGTAASWRLGAQILWYGGDLVDTLLVIVFFTQWLRVTGRQLRHEQRRLATSAPATGAH